MSNKAKNRNKKKFRFGFKRKTNFKIKLVGYAGLAICLVLGIVATGYFFFSRIETSNIAIDQANLKITRANQSIKLASQAIEAADADKTTINKVVKDVMALRLTEKTYLQMYSASLKSQFKYQSEQIEKKLEILNDTDLIKSFNEYHNAFFQYVDIHSAHKKLKGKMGDPLEASQKLLSGIIAELEAKQQEKHAAGEPGSTDLSEAITSSRDCQVALLTLEGIQKQFKSEGNPFYIARFKKMVSGDAGAHLDALIKYAETTNNETFLNNAKKIKELLNTGIGLLEQSQTQFSEEGKLLALMNKTGVNIIKSADGLLRKADVVVAEAKDKASQERDNADNAAKLAVVAKESAAVAKKRAMIIISSIVISGILVFLILSFFLFRAIIKPLNLVIEGLSDSARQVSSGSTQIAGSSYQLSEGASQQAASIEETSSSLEEMSSMTKQNANNAQEADRLMKGANQVVGNANNTMVALTTSMEEISKASGETSKIIKTIDEIAFQTNLLALNAAVEAARAGEAGAGFAVVADEVRNLAMRAADAAKNTALLIEGTVKKVKDGSELVADTNDAFSEVAENATKAAEIVGEIASASNEQAEGIEQVNKAVVEMDKVVQQNAANAEESAAASEEMSTQAEQMKKMVADLVALVGKKDGQSPGNGSSPEDSDGASQAKANNMKKNRENDLVANQTEETRPEQIIPMDGDDEAFKDF
jgi:Methyl-accepting chemotaxis protein (MCP) signalling domain